MLGTLSEGLVNVHLEDPQNVQLVHAPLFNVGPMVVLKILHTSLLGLIELAKLQFSYMKCEG
jgi:hypothetical protein